MRSMSAADKPGVATTGAKSVECSAESIDIATCRVVSLPFMFFPLAKDIAANVATIAINTTANINITIDIIFHHGSSTSQVAAGMRGVSLSDQFLGVPVLGIDAACVVVGIALGSFTWSTMR